MNKVLHRCPSDADVAAAAAELSSWLRNILHVQLIISQDGAAATTDTLCAHLHGQLTESNRVGF